MSMMTELRRKVSAALRLEKKSVTSVDLLSLFNSAGYSRSGAYVNWTNACAVTAVLGCVRVIAEDIAKVPLKLYLGEGTARKTAVDHPLYKILARRPNEWMTAFQFREMLIASAVLAGNGYAIITRDIRGRILELLPIPPQYVQVRRPIGTWDVEYIVTLPNGGGVLTVQRKNMLHLRGISLDGLIGTDIVRMAREAIGLAFAVEEQQAKFARGGLKSAGVLETDSNLTVEQVKELTKLWTDEWGGVHNADKTPILYNGLKFNSISANGKDAEIISTRTFQVEEIARVFRVYPILIGSSSGLSSRSSITDIFQAHVSHCLQPWAVRIEQSLDDSLLTDEEQDAGYYFQVVLQGLLRGDSAARAQFYHNGIIDGWMTRNEARVNEEMNPLPGLDDPLQPLNMNPISPDADDGAANPALGSDNEAENTTIPDNGDGSDA